jgi:hypothetical protein
VVLKIVKMTINSIEGARRIGGRKAAAGFLWIFLLMEAFGFFVETRGDFSSGVQSFMERQRDWVFIGLVVVMLGTVFLLGRAAGRQILVDERNHLLVALTNTLFTLLVSVGYVWVVGYFLRFYVDSWASLIVLLALICGCIWMIAVRGIKRAGNPQ